MCHQHHETLAPQAKKKSPRRAGCRGGALAFQLLGQVCKAGLRFLLSAPEDLELPLIKDKRYPSWRALPVERSGGVP